jgi:hypothetical protein
MELTIRGMINKKGELGIYDKNQLKEFCRTNPGSNILILISTQAIQQSSAMKGYYYAKVIPDMVAGFIEIGELHTKQECEEKLRALCPITRKEELVKGQWKISSRKVEELNNVEFVQYIEWCNYIYSTYMNIKERIDENYCAVKFNPP